RSTGPAADPAQPARRCQAVTRPDRDAVRHAMLILKGGAANLLRRVPEWPGEPVEVSVDDGAGLELLVALRRKAGATPGAPASIDPRRLLDYFLSPGWP